MTTNRIYLVGFMGAGKSTVGRELAHRMHWPFFDLDAEIERVEGSPVRTIFQTHGEPRFREMERERLRLLSEKPKGVIALGGGAYIDDANRSVVEATGVSVFLDASFSAISQRIRPDGSRPLWADPEKARELYDQRRPFYSLARLTLLTDNQRPDVIANEIMRKVKTL